MTETFPDIHDPATGPADLLADLTAIFTSAITNHPRSLQTRIGPSEIGHPCARRIGYKLAGVQPVNDTGLPWKPTIGTAMHTWSEETIARHVVKDDRTGEVGPRFLLEQRVDIGEVNGTAITGCCDIYDRLTATVGDYKYVGGTQLRKYKEHGPGDQYRIQAHAYGRGLVRAGYPVEHVAVWFLPRDQEFKQFFFWSEPYDESVVLRALERLEGVAKLAAAMKAEAVPLLPTADSFCRFCPHYLPASTDLPSACPGHPGSR